MITPRGPEVAAIAETLDAGEYENAEELAGAVIKQVANLIQQRDGREGVGLYLVLLQGCPVGPFYGEAEAKRWVKDAETRLGLTGRVVRLYAPEGGFMSVAHEHGALTCSCGHPKELHVEKKKGQRVTYAECGVYLQGPRHWCPCGTFSHRQV